MQSVSDYPRVVLVTIHAAATWFMTGLIWCMQLVHYPALKNSTPGELSRNIKRTARLVIPAMLVEAAAAVMLLRQPPHRPPTLEYAGAILLAAIWTSTLFFQLPLHRRLAKSHSDRDFATLMLTNWLRVAAWSARGAVAYALLRRAA